VCAVKRRRVPAGKNPTGQPLQPEATGAVMEETNWLKTSVMLGNYPDTVRRLVVMDDPIPGLADWEAVKSKWPCWHSRSTPYQICPRL